ncbi:MAG: biopolymer transporter ExbD [Dysgonomonas sp.]|nr:biopolymer transporter ExbD [Dysgonomonas sp.]
MANIETNKNEGKVKKSKPKKHLLRVDFTPMVDMNMLLITFFMFCSTLSIPQVMDIAMPANEGDAKIPESKTVTMLLGENNKIYYYEGIANYEDYTSLKEADYMEIRKVLLERNAVVVSQMKNLKQKLYNKQISDKEYSTQLAELKKSKDGLIVVIKPTKDSNFENLVNTLDEMQICGIDKYTIVDMSSGDDFLIDNLKAKGTLTAMADFK